MDALSSSLIGHVQACLSHQSQRTVTGWYFFFLLSGCWNWSELKWTAGLIWTERVAVILTWCVYRKSSEVPSHRHWCATANFQNVELIIMIIIMIIDKSALNRLTNYRLITILHKNGGTKPKPVCQWWCSSAPGWWGGCWVGMNQKVQGHFSLPVHPWVHCNISLNSALQKTFLMSLIW